MTKLPEEIEKERDRLADDWPWLDESHKIAHRDGFNHAWALAEKKLAKAEKALVVIEINAHFTDEECSRNCPGCTAREALSRIDIKSAKQSKTDGIRSKSEKE